MGDLADELMSLPSRVTRQIHRLETQNLVRACSSPEDGRGVLATITDEGREAAAAAMVTYGDGVRAHFLARLSRAQVAALGENCRRIGVGLKSDAAPARLGARSSTALTLVGGGVAERPNALALKARDG